ncbi:MAG: PIN domain-containing protein [Chloroflexota bacterium]
MTPVLDSWAVLAYLQDEPGAGTVDDYLRKWECLLSAVNYTEVLYWLERRKGQRAAERFEADVLDADSPVRMVVLGPKLAARTALVKAAGGMSLGDAYAAALTLQVEDGILLTGDPELRAGSERWGYRLEWLGRE